jgi:phospholipid-binding lipoprotein MlaA
MESPAWIVPLFCFIAVGCAHSPTASLSLHPEPDHSSPAQLSASPTQSGDVLAQSGGADLHAGNSLDYREEEAEEKAVTVPDPLEPFNRAMFQFNDKLYFWVLKPVARQYSKVVPEGGRISVRNFLYNLAAPIRLVNCVLQADFNRAALEVSRFAVNTLIGLGGLFDPASSKEMNLVKQDKDLGQTLGVWGVRPGVFLVWPFLGPSTLRDTVGMVGDLFMVNPLHFYSPSSWYVAAGIKGSQKINDTSLKIGDYEYVKEEAIDPYLASRDAYLQVRQRKVEEVRLRPDEHEKRGRTQ